MVPDPHIMVRAGEKSCMFLILVMLNRLIQPKLERLPSRCRVVTYLYKFPGGHPHEAKHFLRAKDSSDEVAFPVYMYTFPSSSAAAAANKKHSGL